MWQIRFIVFAAALASCLLPTSVLRAQVDAQDSLALVALYNSTNGALWKSHENWLTGSVSTWEGITVMEGRVTHVILPENNLSGTLPPEIGALTQCLRLDLSTNGISGGIPSEIGNLTRCTSLDLGRNELTGSIPSAIGNLNVLRWLNLNGNELSGSIPSSIGNMDSLRTLILSVNQLSGPIPNSLFSLVKLQDLHLNQNQLDGELSSAFGNMASLRFVAIHLNEFTGTIPAAFGNLPQLSWLNLNGNNLEGGIPPSLGNLTQLEFLSLHHNSLSGAVPGQITQCRKLATIVLEHNQLTGLPDLTSIDSLRELDVHDNRLTFEDIEPNIGIPGIIYSPQARLGRMHDTTLTEGGSIIFSVTAGGSANQYQWMKDGEDIPGARSVTYAISQITPDDEGRYVCEVTSSIVRDLTLLTEPVTLIVDEKTEVDIPARIPPSAQLGWNYPNPFSERTVIPLRLSSPSPVSLEVHDLLGRCVRRLLQEHRDSGTSTVTWNGRDDHGRLVPPGIYLLLLRTPQAVEARRLVIAR